MATIRCTRFKSCERTPEIRSLTNKDLAGCGAVGDGPRRAAYSRMARYCNTTDDNPAASLFPKIIHTGFIYTMGATEDRLKEVGYEKAIALNEVFLRRVFGKSESLLSIDTFQRIKPPDATNNSRRIAKKPLRWGKDSPPSNDGVNLTTGYRGVEMSPRLHLRWQLLPYFKRQQASV